MLTPEQVVLFLQHDDPIVRGQVKDYFRDTQDFGPLTADHFWAVIDRFGENDETLGFASQVSSLPQTDASFDRLLRALGSKPAEHFEFHYQHSARDMELAFVARRKDELLACPQLLPHVRRHLELRLKLLDDSPAAAWNRLMMLGKELIDASPMQFDESASDALVEAAARGGTEVCELAMGMLDDPSAAEDWREIFAVRVLGMARWDPAVETLIEKYNIDADVLPDECSIALIRIASPRTIARIVDFYPGKPWHVRLCAAAPLARIKRPESEAAVLELLGVELAVSAKIENEDEDKDFDADEDNDSGLVIERLHDLTGLCSLAGLDESRRQIAEFPNGPERLGLTQSLLATAIMNGVVLPEEALWRTRLRKKRTAAELMHDADRFFREIRDRWRETGVAYLPEDEINIDDPASNGPKSVITEDDLSSDRLEPIRNTTPKVGRNDPCPCGSGKKYKKCCWKP